VKTWLNSLSNWVFPKICCFCGEASELPREICQGCYNMLPWNENACFRCGSELLTENEHIHCHRCQENPPAFDKLSALFRYQPPVVKLITGLKFSGQLHSGRILGELFAEKIKEFYKQGESLPEAIIPVPLSIKRLRKRGYNQALELLYPLAKSLQIPILHSVCQKIKHTTPQSELSREKRRRNLKGAFTITNAKSLENLEHVAIFDDVVTTGSTAQALSRLLKEHGVSRVDVLCCCRA